MSSRMVRVIALIWTAAALFQAMSLALRLRDGDWGWGFWLSMVLLLVWVSGAAAYWMLPRTQLTHSAARPARPAVSPARAVDPPRPQEAAPPGGAG